MNNYAETGFNLWNVRKNMQEIDGDLISKEEYLQKSQEEYADP